MCYNETVEPEEEQLTQRRKLVGDEPLVDDTWYLAYGPNKMVNNSTYYLPFIP